MAAGTPLDSNWDALPWTVVDLADRLGPIALSRVRSGPHGRAATEQDVLDLYAQNKQLYELADGILVQKTVGNYETYLAIILAELLSAHVRGRKLGCVFGADGMIRLAPGLVRIPDVSYFAWDSFPNRTLPRTSMSHIAPDLAVEIISPSNTRNEMDRKLADYFNAGVKLVWYVYPNERQVHVYTAVDQREVLAESAELTGGNVLPEFRLPLETLFATPQG